MVGHRYSSNVASGRSREMTTKFVLTPCSSMRNVRAA